MTAVPPVPAVGAGMGYRDESGGVATTRADRSRWTLFVALAAGVAIVDQIAKAWIVATYDVGVVHPILGDLIRIVVSHNSGALFGLFRDSAILFAIFSFGVIGLILFYESRAGRALLVTLALGLLLGGAMGNLADRLRYGFVVDFVDLGIGTLRFYTFNVADSAISTAVLILLLLAVVPGLGGASRGVLSGSGGRDG